MGPLFSARFLVESKGSLFRSNMAPSHGLNDYLCSVYQHAIPTDFLTFLSGIIVPAGHSLWRRRSRPQLDVRSEHVVIRFVRFAHDQRWEFGGGWYG